MTTPAIQLILNVQSVPELVSHLNFFGAAFGSYDSRTGVVTEDLPPAQIESNRAAAAGPVSASPTLEADKKRGGRPKKTETALLASDREVHLDPGLPPTLTTETTAAVADVAPAATATVAETTTAAADAGGEVSKEMLRDICVRMVQAGKPQPDVVAVIKRVTGTDSLKIMEESKMPQPVYKALYDALLAFEAGGAAPAAAAASAFD